MVRLKSFLVAIIIISAIGRAFTQNVLTVSTLYANNSVYVYNSVTVNKGDALLRRIKGYNNNLLFGTNSGLALTTGINNNLFGVSSGLHLTTGSNNNIIGTSTCPSLITGSYNNIIGFNAGGLLTSGSSNVFIGDFAGGLITTGTKNLFLGYSAGLHFNDHSNWIILSTVNHGSTLGDSIRSAVVIHENDSTANTIIAFNGKTTVTENLTATKDFVYSYPNYSGRATALTYTPNVTVNTPFRLALVLTAIKTKNIAYTGDTALVIAIAGNYKISLNLYLTATAAGETYKVNVYKNNSLVTIANPTVTSTGAAYYFSIPCDWDLQGLNFGNIITFKITNVTNSNDPTIKEVLLMANKKPE